MDTVHTFMPAQASSDGYLPPRLFEFDAALQHSRCRTSALLTPHLKPDEMREERGRSGCIRRTKCGETGR